MATIVQRQRALAQLHESDFSAVREFYHPLDLQLQRTAAMRAAGAALQSAGEVQIEPFMTTAFRRTYVFGVM